MDNGWAGKILFANLTTGELRSEPSVKYEEWLGGRGLALHLFEQAVGWDAPDPRQQPLAVAAGRMVGTGMPVGVRTGVCGRSRLTGGVFYSNVGGDFGTRLKQAGFDALLIEGASTHPVALWLEGGEARLVDAGRWWGLKIGELCAAVGMDEDDAHSQKRVSTLAIGPSGEQLAPISCLMVDRGHAAGWGGSGAIFGAKQLKALVAVGQSGQVIPAAEPEQLAHRIQELEWRIDSSEALSGLVRGGTHGQASAGGYTGLVPTAVNNTQDEWQSPAEAAPIREDKFKQWQTGRAGCSGCRIRCLHRYRLDSERFGQHEIEGMHANSVRGLGSNLGLLDGEALLVAHSLCEEYGLDVDGVTAGLGLALECAERGILEREQEGGVHLDWGSPSLVTLIEQIGQRKGLGALLGEGAASAAQEIGRGAQDSALTTKNVGINEQALRSHRAWALGVMVSTRGAGHLGGSPQSENRRYSPEVGERLFHVRSAGDPTSYTGKGKLVAYTECIKAAIDSLGLCYFVFGWYEPGLSNPSELAGLAELVTGRPISADDLLALGKRIHSQERLLTYRLAGLDRRSDTLPDRFFDTAVGSGPYAGAHLDRDEAERMKDEYYAALGWDVATGLPPGA